MGEACFVSRKVYTCIHTLIPLMEGRRENAEKERERRRGADGA
jgi:hypothetical protein